MKHNFILTPETVSIFIQRFDRMLSVTGMIEGESEYTGAQKIKSMLASFGIDKPLLSPVVKTVKSYIDKDTYSYDSYPSNQKIGTGEGLIIRVNDDSSIVIMWGQKIKFTPNRIVLIGSKSKPFYIKCGSTTTYKISNNIKLGKIKNEQENAYAKAYWNDYEEDRFGKDDWSEKFDVDMNDEINY